MVGTLFITFPPNRNRDAAEPRGFRPFGSGGSMAAYIPTLSGSLFRACFVVGARRGSSEYDMGVERQQQVYAMIYSAP